MYRKLWFAGLYLLAATIYCTPELVLAVDIDPNFDGSICEAQKKVINAKIERWEGRLPHQNPEHKVEIDFKKYDFSERVFFPPWVYIEPVGPDIAKELVRAGPITRRIPEDSNALGRTILNKTKDYDKDGRPIHARIEINDNNNIDWYVDANDPPTDGNVPAGQYDLWSVINHELAHALGFTITCPRFSEHVTPDDPNDPNSPRKYNRGGDPNATLVPEDGGTHLDPNVHPDDLMNPTISTGERRRPSGLDVNMLLHEVWSYNSHPIDGEEDVSVEEKLRWKVSDFAEEYDVYLGTDFNDVNDADTSDLTGIYRGRQDVNSYDPCGFLRLDQTYYWRIDEVNDPNIRRGDVWSFTTSLYAVVEDYDSYTDTAGLRNVWKDGSTNGTSSEVYIESTITRDGNSMRYLFRNDLYPYYSESYATIADLEMDPNWEGIGAEALALWFYGQADNDANEQMYLKLTDGDGNSCMVEYPAIGDIKMEEWQSWNISLESFSSAGVDLTDVNLITIGFDNSGTGSSGTVYFEDVRLYVTKCILAERDANFARVDYAPLGYPGGDCVVNYLELQLMADAWLNVWDPIYIWPSPPDIPNLVAWWRMDEGDGNRIFTDSCDANYTGTFSDDGVSWVTPGSPYSEDAGLHFDGSGGTRVSCGNENPASEANELTLAIWVKWAGPLTGTMFTSQGLISKKSEWSADGVMFMLDVDSYSDWPRGTFSLRQYYIADTDVFAPDGLMTEYIGKWVHIAATYDGSTATLYFNGNDVNSGPFGFGGGTDAGLTIGNTYDDTWPNSPEAFKGDLDEACIYSRALTAEEIKYLAHWPPQELKAPNLFDECWECPAVINFRDFAVLANYWLEEDMFL